MTEAALPVEDPVWVRPGWYVDSDHPDIQRFAEETVTGLDDPREQAIALYLRVRDEFRYDPYNIDRSPEGFRASWVMANGRGFCVNKATLLAAVARATGIPARLGYADVRNHLTSAKLRESMGTDVFTWHGYTELAPEGRWVKATPAFNLSLCEKTGVVPLEFDGRTDSIFHPFAANGSRHMEYLTDHGCYADVPFERIMAGWARHYGTDVQVASGPGEGDFEADAAAYHQNRQDA